MHFDSASYLILFLPAVALVHWALRRLFRASVAQTWLLLASFAFYSLGAAPLHLFLLAASILCNWSIARRMCSCEQPAPRRAWLHVGLWGNIVFLGVFKYTAFFLGGVYPLLHISAPVPHLAFPLGISFYTLTSIMYLVDSYQKLNEPLSLFDYSSAIAFFPYVTSGPIVRGASIASQFHGELQANERAILFTAGLYRLASGLLKKIVLADLFANLAQAGFASMPRLSFTDAWIASVAYTLQIYFDFSGYSDIAVGSAALLGIRIPENFNWPYISASISEFWQRWHMSLSLFITHYLYTPLVRSFGKATLRTSAIATLLAMAIIGLWHGPAMTYVVFGAMHGVALVINQVAKKRKIKLPRPVGWLLTILFVNSAFVVFRAPDLAAAAHALRMMYVPFGAGGAGNLVHAQLGQFLTVDVLVRSLLLGLPLLLVLSWRNNWRHAAPEPATSAGRTAMPFVPAAACALLYSQIVYCVLFVGTTAQGFIYTQF